MHSGDPNSRPKFCRDKYESPLVEVTHHPPLVFLGQTDFIEGEKDLNGRLDEKT